MAAIEGVQIDTPDLEATGRVTNARRRDSSHQHERAGETVAEEAGTEVHASRREQMTPEKGSGEHPARVARHA